MSAAIGVEEITIKQRKLAFIGIVLLLYKNTYNIFPFLLIPKAGWFENSEAVLFITEWMDSAGVEETPSFPISNLTGSSICHDLWENAGRICTKIDIFLFV